MKQTATKYKQTELGLIPEDWIESTFGETFTGFSSGMTPFRGELEYYKGDIPWITSGELNYNVIMDTWEKITDEAVIKTNLKIHPVGTFLMAITGLEAAGTRGSCAITGIRATTNQSCMALFPIKGKTTTDYLYHFYVHYGNELAFKYCQGTKQQSYTGRIAKRLPINLPPTVEEQKAIADVLSDTDSLIQALEQKIEKKKLIKKGAIQKLMTPKESWQIKTIKEIANYRRGSFPQPYGLPQWYDDISGMPFIQVVDVEKNFKLKRETKQKISKAGAEMSVFVKKGTVILTIQGSIGRICITDYDAYVDRTLLIFESLKEDFDMYFFMLSIWLKFQTEKQNAPGGIIKTITKEALSSFEIAYPKKEEQSQIAKALSDMENEITFLQNNLEKYTKLKQGLMQQLLTGKIRLI